VVVLWAEQDVILHDQFRDGHVPAGCGNVRVLQHAVATLPQGITEIRLRADSALCETEVLRWCEEEDHKIAYAISADMSEQLKAEIRRLPASAWQVEREEPEAIRAWAEVPYVPDDGDHRKDRPCVRRYLAVRVQQRQGHLFADGSDTHYFAVVTNRPEDGLAILQWHREKAGTVEHAHHVLKNELAAAVLPSGKFGVNAAWFRLNVLTYNLLTALKRLTVPRRSPDRPAEAVAVLTLQHGREGRRACPPDAPPTLGRPAACLTVAGPAQDRAPCARLAGD
jgi:Transposase DDE domain group 1